MFRVIVLVFLLMLAWMVTGFPTGAPMMDGIPVPHAFLDNTNTRWVLATLLLIPAAVIAFALTRALPLVRILVILLVVFTVALATRWLYEQPGGIDITFQETKFSFGVLQVAALGLIGSVFIIAFYNAMRWLWTGPRAVGRWLGEKRVESGYVHLSRAMVAVAAGDANEARAHGRKAESKLDNPAVTRLINAQAAQLAGDNEGAEKYFSAMLDDKETEFLGLRGLIVQALRQGDKPAALRHARRAVALRPGAEWVNTTLFDLQTEQGDWEAARKTITAKPAANVFGKGIARRREAVLLMKQAEALLAKGNKIAAQPIVLKAMKAAPGLVPAAVIASRLIGEEGKTRKAEKILADAWVLGPHPDIVTAYSALTPDETPAARRGRFARLFQLRPNHDETHLAKAELAIQAEDWAAAENALEPFISKIPNARVCTLMATVEQGRGSGEDIVRAWLARALAAPRGTAWVCGNCTYAEPAWAAICPACGAFDTLGWQEPKPGDSTLALPESVLPLLTAGARDGEAEEVDAPTDLPVTVDTPPAAAAEAPQAEPQPPTSPRPPVSDLKPAEDAKPTVAVIPPIVVDAPAPAKRDDTVPPRPDGI